MWQLALPLAHFRFPGATALVDLVHPELGLHGWQFGSQSLPGVSTLRLQAPWPVIENERLVEAYVRGDDLVASYGEDAHQTRTQVYWRALGSIDPEVLGGVELRVSVQTNLLDSLPRVLVGAEMPVLSGQSSPAISAVQVFRPSGIELSYVQVVCPADFGGAQVLGGATVKSESVLQFARLEKGVIRCGRVRGWWVSRSRDQQIAAQLAEEFRVAPLPLTA